MNNNAELFEYGILTERSDMRAHVAVLARRVLIFSTREMVDLIRANGFRVGLASQLGVDGMTGKGVLVPIEKIPHLYILKGERYDWSKFPPRSASTSERGEAAFAVVKEALARGRFPLPVNVKGTGDSGIEMRGTDMIVCGRWNIQVKCDWTAGKKEWAPGCTGNIFIQTHERNPHKRI